MKMLSYMLWVHDLHDARAYIVRAALEGSSTDDRLFLLLRARHFHDQIQVQIWDSILAVSTLGIQRLNLSPWTRSGVLSFYGVLDRQLRPS